MTYEESILARYSTPGLKRNRLPETPNDNATRNGPKPEAGPTDPIHDDPNPTGRGDDTSSAERSNSGSKRERQDQFDRYTPANGY